VDKLRSGESLMYSWTIGLGADFVSLFAYYLASPLNWFILLCPKGYVIEFMSILMILRISLCGLTFAYYLKKHFHTNHPAIAVFGTAYALSAFMAAYAWNVMWTDCLVLAPLIILGVEQLVKDKTGVRIQGLEGINPVKILVEDELVRAVKGGTGFTKCGGNYAGSILGQVKAEKMGYSQVLWLDGEHRKYVEEVGTMNIMFKIAGEIYTAPIEGTVLPGVTRDSMIHLLRDWGYKVNETRLSVDDLMKAGHDGTLEEVFGTGTAAVISPVGELRYKDDVVTINDFKIGELTQKLYDTLTGIQWGRLPDKYGWTVEVK